MDRRPLSLTIIGAFLAVTGIYGVYSGLTMGSNAMVRDVIAQSGLSLQFQQGLTLVGAIVALVSAYGIWKGLPWSRVLYVGWSLIAFVIGLLTSPFVGLLIVGFLLIAVIAFFLFRPAADAWFAAKGLQLQRSRN